MGLFGLIPWVWNREVERTISGDAREREEEAYRLGKEVVAERDAG